MTKRFVLILLLGLSCLHAFSENGYRLWLRYEPLNHKHVAQYKKVFQQIVIPDSTATQRIIRNEWNIALKGMMGTTISFSENIHRKVSIVYDRDIAVYSSVVNAELKETKKELGEDGYIIRSQLWNGKKQIFIRGKTDKAWLYATFHLLRLIQSEQPVADLNIISIPRIQLRLLNHWDNLDRTVERGYAGQSIWNWHTLPGFEDKRYTDYARANASIGINGTVLTNVNANATILTAPYLQKVKKLADIFRPYGIRVYLTARFSAPIEAGGLSTADPLNDAVKKWWNDKAKEIYSLIPDFGGFLVKANSEGQPGPQNYNRTHADGANMLADAVAPFGGIVMWRAFVYSNELPEDRHKQANLEFEPLDGAFRDNVIVQVKNGAIDFQPREPFHPLFGAMQKTPLMLELQITQEYLGQATNLVYLAPMFKECLNSDTYRPSKGNTVAQIIDGSSRQQTITAIAGVSNIGNDINWT
ncbi:MAG: alpha-glucuronidase, partial [Chitinophagaceae bacterium]|nr:alpha-glucuronidase [Chitinophagaceae bacterium]